MHEPAPCRQCSTTPFGPSMMPTMMPTPAPVTPGQPAPKPVAPAPAAPTPSDLTPYQASRVAFSTPVTFPTQFSYGNAQLAQVRSSLTSFYDITWRAWGFLSSSGLVAEL